MKTLVLVGSGHAHIAVLRRFARRPVAGARLVLVTPLMQKLYSGMLPGVVAGRYSAAEAQVDVAALARSAGAELVLDRAFGLDLLGRRVLCEGAAVPFDVVSLDIGSQPNTGSVPGAAEHTIPVKPIDGFLLKFDDVLARVKAGQSRHVAVVGGGAGGVELMLAVAHRLHPAVSGLRLTLVTGASGLLPGLSAGARARLGRALAARGVAVRSLAVAEVTADGLVMSGGDTLAADEILWATEAAPAPWLAESGLTVDAGGFVMVDHALRATDGVFAAGDMIAFGAGDVARSGVQAVRAAPVLAANLRATVLGGRLRRHRASAAALAIVGTGNGSAVAARGRWSAEGRWAWWLKTRLDRRFVAGPAVK